MFDLTRPQGIKLSTLDLAIFTFHLIIIIIIIIIIYKAQYPNMLKALYNKI